MVGPGELEGDAVRDRAQPVEALELGELVGEAHVVQLAHRARREPVAAGLLAGKVLLLDHEDAVPARREPVGGRRPGRSRADDEHVEFAVDSRRFGAGRVAHARHDHMPSKRGSTDVERPRELARIGRAAGAQCALARSSVVARATRPLRRGLENVGTDRSDS